MMPNLGQAQGTEVKHEIEKEKAKLWLTWQLVHRIWLGMDIAEKLKGAQVRTKYRTPPSQIRGPRTSY